MLELAEPLAEGPAGGEVLHGDVEGGLGQADPGGADGHPGVGQDRESQLEPLALLAEEVVLGELDAVEGDVGGELAPLAELLVETEHRQAAHHGHPGGVLERDQQERRTPARPAQGHHDVGHRRVGDEPLPAVDDPPGRRPLGHRLEPLRREVGRRLGLGGGERGHDVAGGEGGQVPLPDPGRAVLHRPPGPVLQPGAVLRPEREAEQVGCGQRPEGHPGERLDRLLRVTDLPGARRLLGPQRAAGPPSVPFGTAFGLTTHYFRDAVFRRLRPVHRAQRG